jgi:hypothetical protein
MKKVFAILLLVLACRAFCQTADTLVYTHNKSKIELTTDGEKCVLKNGKINSITIITKNLDSRVMTCSGPGLRYVRPLDPEKTISLWEINLTHWEAGKPYILFFNYRGKKTQFSGKFEIPVN